MPLSTHVQDRYSSQYLVELTNPQNRGATTVNTTILDNASADVDALFDVYSGVEYDDTDAQHIAVAVEGVIAFLMRRTGQSAAESRITAWVSSMRDLSRIEGRNRVTPDSTTRMQPSADDRLTSTPRPAFDDRRFDPFLPKAPGGGV